MIWRPFIICHIIAWTAFHGLAAAPRGDVVAWGLAQPFPPPEASNNIIQIASGLTHHLALRADGEVVGWNGFFGSIPPGLHHVKFIAAGANHNLAVLTNGTVVGWGENSSLQTNVPAGLSGVVAVGAGDFHSLALTSSGAVVGWGANNYGQAAAPALSGVVAIAAGGNHSLALRKVQGGGRIVGWGYNSVGQARAPSSLTNGLINVVAIAAGANHSLALDANGQVYGWGQNTYGQAAPPSGLNNVVAIAAGGDDSLALRANGSVAPWGATATGSGAPPTTLSNVIAISVGDRQDAINSKLALVFRPLVLNSPPTNLTVTAGQTAVFRVTANGAEPLQYQWQKDGADLPFQTSATLTLNNTQRGDAGLYGVLVSAFNGATTNAEATLTINSPPEIVLEPQDVVTNAGQTVRFEVSSLGTPPLRYQWRHEGQPVSGGTLSNLTLFGVQDINSGIYTVVITNQFGSAASRMARLTVNLLPIITRAPQSQTVGLGQPVTFSVEANYATRYQWRKENADLLNQTNANLSMNDAQFSDSGNYSVLVANQYGNVLSPSASLNVNPVPIGATNVVTWGQKFVFNGAGFIDTSTPPGLSNAVRVAAGKLHSLALLDNGAVRGWGDNSRGQSAVPANLNNVTAIAAGGYHSLALESGGIVVGWGEDSMGQASPPPNLNEVIAIAAGEAHSVAVRNNGEFAGWGANEFGQRTAPPGLPGLRGIAAGFDFTLGLTTNAVVVGWGNNEFGQARPPSSLSNVLAIAAGRSHGVALRQDGTVAAWGRNDHEQTNVPPDLGKVIAIAAGANHCLALLASGQIVGWGQDNEAQLQPPAGLGASSIAAAGDRSLAVIQRLYKLSIPVPGTGDSWRFYIRTTDQSPITEFQLTQIEVRATTNPALPLTNWSVLPAAFFLENGAVRFDDFATSFARRFYTVVAR